MDYTKIRVLVTDGGARQTLAILHGLKKIGCYVVMACTSKFDVGYASRLPDKKILDERFSTSNEEWLSHMIEVIKEEKIDVLLPIAEMSTNMVTSNEDELKKYVRLACAPRAAYLNAFDKQRTFELAAECDIPRPKTRRTGQSVEDYLQTVEFPLIIKPRNGMGSIGFHKFEKREDFWPYVQEKGIDLDQYVLQEFVNYEKRLGAVFVVDQKGNVCMSYANEILRWYPIDAGTACMIRSIDYPELLENAARLLKAMHWQGVCALSFMVDINTQEPKLLEINGRIPASIRLTWQLGFNVAEQLIQMAFDQRVKVYPPNRKFGICTRHFHAEVLWFLKSKTRFSAEPSWFSWKNTKDVVYWRDDKKPFFVYSLQRVFKYKDFKKKRQH